MGNEEDSSNNTFMILGIVLGSVGIFSLTAMTVVFAILKMKKLALIA